MEMEAPFDGLLVINNFSYIKDKVIINPRSKTGMITGYFLNMWKQRYEIYYFFLLSSTQDAWVELILSTKRGPFDIVYLTDKNEIKFA